MKMLIEVKRGELVPLGAKWLKDYEKVVDWVQEGFGSLSESVAVYYTFDVFEVAEDGRPIDYVDQYNHWATKHINMELRAARAEELLRETLEQISSVTQLDKLANRIIAFIRSGHKDAKGN